MRAESQIKKDAQKLTGLLTNDEPDAQGQVAVSVAAHGVVLLKLSACSAAPGPVQPEQVIPVAGPR